MEEYSNSTKANRAASSDAMTQSQTARRSRRSQGGERRYADARAAGTDQEMPYGDTHEESASHQRRNAGRVKPGRPSMLSAFFSA